MKSFYEINKIMCESFFQSKKFSSDTYFNYKKNMYTTSSNRKKRFGETGLEHNGDFLFPIYYHEFGLKKNIDHPVDMAHGIKFTDRRVSNRVPNSPSGIKNEINIFTEPSQVEKLFNIAKNSHFSLDEKKDELRFWENQIKFTKLYFQRYEEEFFLGPDCKKQDENWPVAQTILKKIFNFCEKFVNLFNDEEVKKYSGETEKKDDSQLDNKNQVTKLPEKAPNDGIDNPEKLTQGNEYQIPVKGIENNKPSEPSIQNDKICPRCKNNNLINSKFCKKCGYQLYFVPTFEKSMPSWLKTSMNQPINDFIPIKRKRRFSNYVKRKQQNQYTPPEPYISPGADDPENF